MTFKLKIRPDWPDRYRTVLGDYRSYLAYTAMPVLGPYVVVGLSRGLRLSDRSSWLELLESDALFMATIGLCGTLMLRVVAVERTADRDGLHWQVFLLLLAGCFGSGLAVAGSTDSVENLHGLGWVFLALAAGPVGLNVSRAATRVQARRVIDLRDRDQAEVANEVAALLDHHPWLRDRIASHLGN